MTNNNFSQQRPTISMEQLIDLMKKLPKSKIEETVNYARKLGISEDYINEGLKIIKKIRNC